MKFVREQFFLAAAAQNIKRLVRFLAQSIPPVAESTPSRVKNENSQQACSAPNVAPITDFFNSHGRFHSKPLRKGLPPILIGQFIFDADLCRGESMMTTGCC
jgi:hypothetical protein